MSITEKVTLYYSQIKQDITEGVTQFKQNPVKYTSGSLVELVCDYWDLALAVSGGVAFGDYQSEDLGIDLRWELERDGVIAILPGAFIEGRLYKNKSGEFYRIIRNILGMGCGFFLHGATNNNEASVQYGNSWFIIGAALGAATLTADTITRKSKQNRQYGVRGIF